MGWKCDARSEISTPGMIRVTQKDQGTADIELGGDSLVFIRWALDWPEMRAGDHDCGAVFFGCFGQGRYTAYEHWHVDVAGV